MSEIEAVIFDLGRVLVDIVVSEEMLARFGVNPEDNLSEIMHRPVFKEYNEGRLTPHEFHEAFCNSLGFYFQFEKFAELWCSIFQPIEGMQRLVEEVAARVKVNLLSDTDPLHWGYISSTWPWIGGMFKHPALSFQVGKIKPDPLCYQTAAQNIGVEPSACLFIDDLPENIAGAKAAGMRHSFQFTGARDTRNRLIELGVL